MYIESYSSAMTVEVMKPAPGFFVFFLSMPRVKGDAAWVLRTEII